MSCVNDGVLAVSRAPQELFFAGDANRPLLDRDRFADDTAGGVSNASRRSRRTTEVSASTGGAGPLGIITALTAPINVVSTAINTCCIGRTDNLVQFTCLINAPLALVTTLVFQVFRTSCVGTPVPVGSSYTYAATIAALSSQSFAFSFLDEDVAPGTYTYSVQLTTGTTTSVAGLSVTNATLSVIATADD